MFKRFEVRARECGTGKDLAIAGRFVFRRSAESFCAQMNLINLFNPLHSYYIHDLRDDQ